MGVLTVFVCQCEVVTFDEVAAAVDNGADTVEAVGQQTGAGTGCGICHESIESVLAERCGSCPLAQLAVA
jgi:NAD(P)H-nitrite reductase large subunit